jgi:hypothetical protein
MEGDSFTPEELLAQIKSKSSAKNVKLMHLERLHGNMESYKTDLRRLVETSTTASSVDDQSVLQACIEDLQSTIDQVSQDLRSLMDDMKHLDDLLKKCHDQSCVIKDTSSAKRHEEDANFRWRIAGSLIFKASRQTQDFVEQIFRALHREVCIKISEILDCPPSELHASPDCFSEQELPQTYKEVKTFRQLFAVKVIECHISFARATQSHPIKWCHVNDEENFKQFMSAARNVRIVWHNSEPRHWSHPDIGPFEMAKLFCRSLGSDPPSGFRGFEPSSLFRLLFRCTFFSQTIDSLQLLRQRTIQGVSWSYKCWSTALSTRMMNSEHLSRIRSLLSVFLQEVGIVARHCPNFLSRANITKYFEMAIDSSGMSSISSSTSQSSRRAQSFDNGSDSDTFSAVGDILAESSLSLFGSSGTDKVDGIESSRLGELNVLENVQRPPTIFGSKLSMENKLAAARAVAARPLRVTDTEFAALKLRESFIAATVCFVFFCNLTLLIRVAILL